MTLHNCYFEACGQHCNNCHAELKAIRSALQNISKDCDNPNPLCVTNIVIFTDSQSAIQAIAQMQHHKQPIVTDILTTANKLHNQNAVETSIQWIPGHCDIPGNDITDKLAKQGTSKTQHDEQVSYATSKLIIQMQSRKICHERWARGNTGWIYYQHQQTPNQTDPIKKTTQSTSDCRIWASVKLGDTLAMLIWREKINGIVCCFGGNTDK